MHPDLGSTIITPTVVQGGTKSNVVPESCVLTIDSRTIPQHRSESILAAIRSLVARLHRDDPNFRAKVEVMFPSHHLLVPKEDNFVRLMEDVSGSGSTIAPYGTEAPFYQKLGMASVVFGPGSVRQAHIADEYVSVRDVRRATRIYEKLIRTICL
jgi:acetylornithine deacetylase/succinyl-diaminopimelate desuccinylase-like protein